MVAVGPVPHCKMRHDEKKQRGRVLTRPRSLFGCPTPTTQSSLSPSPLYTSPSASRNRSSNPLPSPRFSAEPCSALLRSNHANRAVVSGTGALFPSNAGRAPKSIVPPVQYSVSRLSPPGVRIVNTLALTNKFRTVHGNVNSRRKKILLRHAIVTEMEPHEALHSSHSDISPEEETPDGYGVATGSTLGRYPASRKSG